MTRTAPTNMSEETSVAREDAVEKVGVAALVIRFVTCASRSRAPVHQTRDENRLGGFKVTRSKSFSKASTNQQLPFL